MYFKNQSSTGEQDQSGSLTCGLLSITRGHTGSCCATRTVPLPLQQQLQPCSFPSAVEEGVVDPLMLLVTEESREAPRTQHYRQNSSPWRCRTWLSSLLQPQPCREHELPPSWTNPGKLADQHSAPWPGTLPQEQSWLAGDFCWKSTVKQTFRERNQISFFRFVPRFFFAAEHVMLSTLDSLKVFNALQRPWNLDLIYGSFSLCFFLHHYKLDLN